MRKNVLILGAGASIGYGPPTGEGFISEILASGNDRLSEKDGHNFFSLNGDFFNRLKTFPAPNIDKFLRDNPSFKDFGRQMIAYTLLKKENENFDGPDNEQKFRWYDLLHYQVNEFIHEKEDFSRIGEWLKIITFNYDVTLDQYLLEGLRRTELTRDNAEEIFEKIRPAHVYGKLYDVTDGSYQYGKHEYYDCSSGIGKEKNAERWLMAQDIYKNIEVIYGNKPTKTLRHKIEYAHGIYFLGFGFDLINLKIVGLGEPRLPTPRMSERCLLGYTNISQSPRIKNTVEIRHVDYAIDYDLEEYPYDIRSAFKENIELSTPLQR